MTKREEMTLELTERERELLGELLFEGGLETASQETAEEMGWAAFEAFGQLLKQGRESFAQEIKEYVEAAFQQARQ